MTFSITLITQKHLRREEKSQLGEVDRQPLIHNNMWNANFVEEDRKRERGERERERKEREREVRGRGVSEKEGTIQNKQLSAFKDIKLFSCKNRSFIFSTQTARPTHLEASVFTTKQDN